MARAPSGLSIPPGMPLAQGAAMGSRSTISRGGVQVGHIALRAISALPDQAKPSRPMPTP
jgi:hypothetical protein